MTAVLDFEAANNATWLYSPILLLDDADAPLALPFDAKVEMQLRSPASSNDVALLLSLENGFIKYIDSQASTVRIEVPVTTMRDIPAGTYEHDIIVSYSTGLVVRSIAGNVNILQGVTR
jgi:hypothetical protein